MRDGRGRENTELGQIRKGFRCLSETLVRKNLLSEKRSESDGLGYDSGWKEYAANLRE